MNVLNNLNLEPYGSSHSSVIGFKLSGIKSGYHIDFTLIDQLLVKRKGDQKINTTRSESEKLEIISGFDQSRTNGEQIVIEIKQTNFKKCHYKFGTIRPGHADISAYQKYGNKWDYSGGGQFSGRMTVLYVISGEICRQIVNQLTSVTVLGHVSQVGPINDVTPKLEQLFKVIDDPLPIVDDEIKTKCQEFIVKTKKNGDSVGGALDIYITDIETNYGDDFFRGLEAKMSFLLFSIPGVKAVEFGIGTQFSNKRGSEVIEKLSAINGVVTNATNYNGGISGGIANLSAPIKVRVTVKPTSTIFHKIDTVKYSDGQFVNSSLQMHGRHDAFIANRALWPMIGLLYIMFLDLEMEERC